MNEQVLRNILKFTKKLKKNPYAKLYAPLGDGYRKVGLLEDGTDICLVGLELFPRYLACNEVLGRIYLRQNRLDEAKQQLEKVHEVIGDNLGLCKALVRLYARRGERERTEELLEWIIKQDPFDFEMRNIRTQLQRELERETRREEAVARGEDPDDVDIFELAERKAVVDIESIISEESDIEYDREAHQRATDAALDGLESIEGAIDASANQLVADAQSETRKKGKKKKRGKKKSALRQDIIDRSIKDLSAAALVAQIELELSLLDEAAIICGRLRKSEPDDDDLKDLHDKFERRIEAKEAQLEELENQNLAHGL